MKNQITEMDKELERYNKSNTHLDLTIKDLRNKLLGMGQDVKRKQKAIEDRDSAIHSFQKDLHEAAKHVQTPKRLAEEVKSLYAKHMTQKIDDKLPDKDIQREYNRQREYLEKTIDQFKRKLAKDVETHKKDNMALMNQNVALIKEINELRRRPRCCGSPRPRRRLRRRRHTPAVDRRASSAAEPAPGAAATTVWSARWRRLAWRSRRSAQTSTRRMRASRSWRSTSPRARPSPSLPRWRAGWRLQRRLWAR